MKGSSLYGLQVSSQHTLAGCQQLEFPCPDVVIREGEVPLKLPVVRYATPFFSAGQQDCLLTLPGLGRCHVRGGADIVMQTESPALWLPELLALPLAVCLEQRGLMVLSGAAVATPDGAWLLLGRNGAGVSTLAFALMRQGHAVLADMLAVVDVRAGHPRLLCEGGDVRLWDDMAAHFQLPEVAPLRPGLAKRRHAGTGAPPSGLLVAGVIVLDREQITAPSHSPLSGLAAISRLAELRYPPGLALRCSPGMLQSSATLAEAVPVHALLRPRGFTDPAPLAALAAALMRTGS